MDHAEKRIRTILEGTRIELNGSNAWDPRIHNKDFYKEVLSRGSLGLGEAYMHGWWDCDDIPEFFYRLLRIDIQKKMKNNWPLFFNVLLSRLLNLQSRKRAFHIGEAHYDRGNKLYERMLDDRMTYTCGYWKHADNLQDAQEAKLDLVCKKLNIQPGQKILDIGCGWGSFAKFAAEKYGAEIVGITVSKEQAKLAEERCKGLPIEIRVQDYRDVHGEFDHIVSLGMIEHVGYKNYKTFFNVCQRILKDDGLFLLHTIGGNVSVASTDPWIAKYIFPNSMIPSLAQLTKSMEGLFLIEDVHNFGADYEKTLLAWHQNFESSWEEMKDQYDRKFYRMWRYYLLSCAGSFRARKNQLWQCVLSKNGVLGGYERLQ